MDTTKNTFEPKLFKCTIDNSKSLEYNLKAMAECKCCPRHMTCRPEFDMMKKMSASTLRSGEDFLQGANVMALQEQKFEEMAEGKEMLPQSTQPQNMGVPPTNTQPQAMTPPPPQNTGQVQAQQYASLFPQDTLGQAVATRQLKEGGFVEDIYNQVDEVLNG